MRWPFMLRRTHERYVATLNQMSEARRNGMRSFYQDELRRAREDYQRVQFGYDQGVLEGMRQAYVNVRATLADSLFTTGGIDGAKIRAFITPLLSDLGTHETRLLDEMKGLTRQREEFDRTASTQPSVNMFPGNNAPQRAVEVPVESEEK